MSDFDFAQAQYQRFLNEKAKIAQRLRDLADAVDRVPVSTITMPGRVEVPREPVGIIGEVTHTVLWGVANLKLDNLSVWAEGVYELRAYDAKTTEPK